ncbi:hypothetical protein Droror1_Dr00003266, partial [Drosera rotundifolia]
MMPENERAMGRESNHGHLCRAARRDAGQRAWRSGMNTSGSSKGVGPGNTPTSRAA